MNKNALNKALKSAAWVALPVALISLLACTLILGSGTFVKLLPAWLFLGFAVISAATLLTPYIAKRFWLKTTISVIIVAVTVVCLCFL